MTVEEKIRVQIEGEQGEDLTVEEKKWDSEQGRRREGTRAMGGRG